MGLKPSYAQIDSPAPPAVLHHDNKVIPDLAHRYLTILDMLTLPAAVGSVMSFRLHRQFATTRDSLAQRVVQNDTDHVALQFTLPHPAKPFVLEYQSQVGSAFNPPTIDYFNSPDLSSATIIIAHQARPEILRAWQIMAYRWQIWHPDWKIQWDNQPLPQGDVIILGGESDAISRLVERTGAYAELNQVNDLLGRENYVCGLHTFALTVRLKHTQVLVLSADHLEGLNRLLAKLPHYGAYSYALFNSTNGDNIAKGQWEALDTPLIGLSQP
ncbi:hypothetical protein [Thiofilum flexile]|uniref:hypothetical protein n=1 Tax=Thiofilum flexile TaxID=125627 RepID=UPI00036D57FA|nr:hypothetical protein [Thiofilum flexile]